MIDRNRFLSHRFIISLFLIISTVFLPVATYDWQAANISLQPISLNDLPDKINFNMSGHRVQINIKDLFSGNNEPGFKYFISSSVIRDALLNTEAQKRDIPIALPVRPDQFMRFVAFCIALIGESPKTAFERSFDPKKGLSILRELGFYPTLLTEIEDVPSEPSSQSNAQLRIVLPNREILIISDFMLQELRSIKPSLIANSFDNLQDTDILTITIPGILRDSSVYELQNFFVAISALYAHGRIPESIDVLIILRTYFDEMNIYNFPAVEKQLYKLRLLALFFEYNEFEKSLSDWIDTLRAGQGAITILGRIQNEIISTTSMEIIKKILISKYYETSSTDRSVEEVFNKIESYRTLSYLLGYNQIYNTLSQLHKILTFVENWALSSTIIQSNEVPIQFIDDMKLLAKKGGYELSYNDTVFSFSKIFKNLLTTPKYAFLLPWLKEMEKSNLVSLSNENFN